MDHTMTKNPDSIPYNIWPAEALRPPNERRRTARADAVRTHAARGRGGVPAGQLCLSCQRALADPLRTWQQRRRRICRCASGTGRGRRVTLLAVESDSPLPEEAQAAREAWLNAGGVIHAATIPWPDDISLIIDGLLGTGLRSAPRDPVAALIHRANHHPAPVVALDIPSGLNAQTGATPCSGTGRPYADLYRPQAGAADRQGAGCRRATPPSCAGARTLARRTKALL